MIQSLLNLMITYLHSSQHTFCILIIQEEKQILKSKMLMRVVI
jgi:hypothetical protein